MSASSSTAEAELVANEAKAMLNEFVNANEILNNRLTEMISDNNDLETNVTSLSKALATSEEALKAEQKTHHREGDGLASELESLRGTSPNKEVSG